MPSADSIPNFPNHPKVRHAVEWANLRDDSLIKTCRDYAYWTLPQLMPDGLQVQAGRRRGSVQKDYQEIGALLVNGLASKLANLLFPSNIPYFKIEPSEQLKAEAEEEGKLLELQSRFAELELDAAKRVFLNGSYAQLILALKHLIVTGNALIYRDKGAGKFSTFGLQSFSAQRDGRGQLLQIILREQTVASALPPEILAALRAGNNSKYNQPNSTVQIYTKVERQITAAGRVVWVESQEADDVPLGEPSIYPDGTSPWICCTWDLMHGENYGRGLVESYAGGFAKLSDLSEAAALYGIEMMRVLHLVAAGGGTDIDDLATAESGEYIQGDPATVHAHEAGNAQKFEVLEAKINSSFQLLSRAFMYSGPARDSERTTAHELQQQAEEAEHQLGGAYSTLADTLQVPLAALLLLETDPQFLAGMLSGDLRPSITAGIPALGRSSDVQNLLLAAQEVIAVVPNLAQIDRRLDTNKVIDMIMLGRSVAYQALLKSPEQLQAEQQAEQQHQQGMQQIEGAEQAALNAQLQDMTGA